MRKFYGYLNSAFYNIRQNKAYALFCTLGSSLTFVFVAIILQLTNDIINNNQPFINADKEISFSHFEDKKGNDIGGIPAEDVPLLMDNINIAKYCSMYDVQYGNIIINDQFSSGLVSFVNGDFWKVNEFEFIQGRPFTQEEIESKAPVVVLGKSFAASNLKNGEILGQKVVFQDVSYTVIGVVNDYSIFAGQPHSTIVPHTFNKFVPDNDRSYSLSFIPTDGVTVNELKEKTVKALKYYYNNLGKDVNINTNMILTQKEARIKKFGDNLLSYGIVLILFVLLLIPAINILVISIANVNNRAKEIALRRTMGATIFSSFIQIMIENLLLVLIGAIIGLFLAVPTANAIGSFILGNSLTGDLSLITKVDFLILIVGILPLLLLFTFLSGGIPAYLVAKGKIANTLKGGSKC